MLVLSIPLRDGIGTLLAANGGVTDPVTLGLGVIAVALFFGEFAFFKWIYNPALERFDKALQASEDRHKEAMTSAEERHKVEMESANARAERLETKLDRQNEVLKDQVLPTLFAAANAVTQSQTFMQELKVEQDRLTRQREIQEAIEQGRSDGTTK
jgi:hypothetical protein